jgi:superoxide dismutase, Cu-Zn family
MRSATWQLAIATGLGIVVAMVISYGTNTSAQTAPAARAQTARPAQPAQSHADGKVTKAIAVVHPLGDSKVGGKVVFTQTRGGVEISAEITGLAPGKHGFHVHEFGDCSMADGTCAGAHFNPTGAPHAGPDDEKRHVGDLGNIEVMREGKSTYKRVDKLISLNGENSIIGRSVIIHADPDDLKSQPSGNAGVRVGCGVIGIADPKMEH